MRTLIDSGVEIKIRGNSIYVNRIKVGSENEAIYTPYQQRGIPTLQEPLDSTPTTMPCQLTRTQMVPCQHVPCQQIMYGLKKKHTMSSLLLTVLICQLRNEYLLVKLSPSFYSVYWSKQCWIMQNNDKDSTRVGSKRDVTRKCKPRPGQFKPRLCDIIITSPNWPDLPVFQRATLKNWE